MDVRIRRVWFWKVLRNMGVEVMVVRTNGLRLRLAGTWNEQVSHYDDSETGKGIRNVRKEKTL